MEQAVFERMARNERRHWWFRGRRRIVAQTLRRAVRRSGPRVDRFDILEAGCGSGGNLELFARFGTVSAFELNDRARATAIDRTGIDVRPGRLPDELPRYDRRFDLIAMLDVLEHVDDDVGSLSALSAFAVEGGSFLITVPALPEMWSAHDLAHHHKRRYTKESLRRTCEAAGLVVEESMYFNSLLLPAARWRRGRSRAPSAAKTDDDLPGPLLNGALDAVFALESVLLPSIRFRAGLSLLALAKRV